MRRIAVVAALLASLLAACGGASPDAGGGGGNGGGVVQPTPVPSLSAESAGTVSQLQTTLAAAGYRLDPPIAPYQAAEPASFASVPRAVYQISTPDPNGGFVVIYQFPDTGTAATRGHELASFLGSGFGQTNYPFDAQFAVSQVGGTLVFTWWSADRSSDDAAAQGAFDLVASVGQPIPVQK
jgi:hypothetical protein